jgi:quercetin dioxygenase-like cupin family protein
MTGAAQVCVLEFWFDPGCAAPRHHHFDVEELIAVVEGLADFEVDGQQRAVEAGESIVLPAGSRHGFQNAGGDVLRVLVVFPVPAPPVAYEEEPGIVYAIAGDSRERRDAHRAVDAANSRPVVAARAAVPGGALPGRGRNGAELHDWRDGVRTRLHAGAATGAAQLCVIEQWCDPGRGAPLHHHFEVEELIAVVEGLAEFEVDGAKRAVQAGGSIVLPAGSRHGFRNAGRSQLRTLAIFPTPAPAVEYEHEPGIVYTISGALLPEPTAGRRRSDTPATRSDG